MTSLLPLVQVNPLVLRPLALLVGLGLLFPAHAGNAPRRREEKDAVHQAHRSRQDRGRRGYQGGRCRPGRPEPSSRRSRRNRSSSSTRAPAKSLYEKDADTRRPDCQHHQADHRAHHRRERRIAGAGGSPAHRHHLRADQALFQARRAATRVRRCCTRCWCTVATTWRAASRATTPAASPISPRR